MNVLSTRHAFFVIALLASGASACGDRCLASDYAPPSARLALRDAVTGVAICSARDFVVTTSVGTPIAHEDTCEWWLPAWIPPQDGGATTAVSEVTLSVAGYSSETVVLDVRRNDCGEIHQPPLRQVDVTRE